MLDGAKAGHFAYIGDSILGNAANLGAGTKLANLKMHKPMPMIAIKYIVKYSYVIKIVWNGENTIKWLVYKRY